LYADLDNTKKMLARTHAHQAEVEVENLIREILPFADNLERVLENLEDDRDELELKRGIALTLKAFLDALQKYGVEPVSALGQEFDPQLHEAAGTVASPASAPGTVVEVEQRGFLRKGKLLRPARVLVAVD
jgi:molecular chaperone GrpE